MSDNGVIGSAVNHDITSDFISVSPNDTWIATGRYNANASSSPEMVIVYQYYDVNKAVIGARSRNTSGKYVTQYSITKTIPAGVAYMRVSSGWVDDGYGSFKIEKGNIPTNWTPAPEDIIHDYTNITGAVGDADAVVTVSNITPANATNKTISATSSNAGVATVSSNDGINFTIHFVDSGTATINIKSNDNGYSKAVTVTVA